MPIHDQGYRRYAGRRGDSSRVWWVIARAGILERVRERRFLALLLLAWAPFLVRAVQIYVATNFSQASFLALSARTFREFLFQQNVFVFFVTLFAGAGLIANDRRANALQIYLSKPLTRTDYIAGKLATLVVFLAAVTWAPAMLLLLMQMLFAGSTAFVAANGFLIPAITAFALVQIAVSACTMLALSSLSKNRRFVSVMYAGLVFFSAAVYQVARRVTGSGAWAVISPRDTLDAVADGLFGLPGSSGLPLPVALLALAILVALSLAIVERRVRGVEVVA
jgi:ABC-2 type transport system permease protein